MPLITWLGLAGWAGLGPGSSTAKGLVTALEGLAVEEVEGSDLQIHPLALDLGRSRCSTQSTCQMCDPVT